MSDDNERSQPARASRARSTDYATRKKDPYFCETCGTGYVVPSLARSCEQSHG